MRRGVANASVPIEGLETHVKRAALIIVVVAAGLTACTSAETVPESATATTTTPTSSASGGGTEAGVAFSLFTHCGISSTEYDGRMWVAATPLPEPRGRADETGTRTNDGYTEGTMTLVDDDLLRFVVTDPLVEEVGLTVDFVPAPAPVPLCE